MKEIDLVGFTTGGARYQELVELEIENLNNLFPISDIGQLEAIKRVLKLISDRQSAIESWINTRIVNPTNNMIK